ncbi:MAG: EAL domain-containing protein [Rhodospirillaceae bacterium]
MANERKLLVFDDDEEIRQMITLLASKEGFEVTPVGTLAEFREAVDQVRPDAIIQDLSLTDCDGIEVLRSLGAQGCKAAIVVISSFDEKLLRSALSLGRDFGLNMIGNLRKPITGKGLREVLSKVPETSQMVREDDLGKAIAGRDLFLTYQPKVDMATGEVRSAEALVRWRDPHRGMIFPDQFISLAEQSGLIEPMTDLILAMAIREAASWKAKGWDIAVAVNLSAATLVDLDFPTKVTTLLAEYGVKANQLILEVTETTAMSDARKTLDILTRLRIKGIAISLDDFGTGYSSLVELHRMPFSELKIDRSFVIGIVEEPDARIITSAILGLGSALGLKVVAEGVETAEHWQFLKDNNCNLAQGYFLTRPLPSEDFANWVENWNNGRELELGLG